MKLLLFQAVGFGYSPESLDGIQPAAEGEELVVCFVHAEPDDEERQTELVKKAAKNIKWLANKREIRAVCLHSFAHLAEEKGDPSFADRFIESLGERLTRNGYRVEHTPFGTSCAWTMTVHQEPIAKVFKSL